MAAELADARSRLATLNADLEAERSRNAVLEVGAGRVLRGALLAASSRLLSKRVG